MTVLIQIITNNDALNDVEMDIKILFSIFQTLVFFNEYIQTDTHSQS